MAKGNKGSAALVDNARRFAAGFKDFSVGQKAVVIAVIAALVGGALVFSRWAATPTYTPMFSNLSAADASAMVDKLTTDGVAYQLADGGSSILVPQDQVYAERLAMAAEGLPSDSQSGYALLDEGGITTSEFVQQKQYQRALSDELATTIEAINGVDTAVVNLAIPQKDVFLNEQDPTTAAVLVKLKPGKELSTDQVTSIVNLVAGGVEGMDTKNVSVVDGEGTTLSSESSGTTAQQEKTGDYNAAASNDLQTMLEGVLGKGNVRATVNATLNFDATTRKSTEYTQPQGVDPLAVTENKESYNGTGTAAATGVLGPDNIGVPSDTAQGGGGYVKNDTTRNPSVNRTDTETTVAPGAVARQSVAVVIDSKNAGTADVAQITQLVSGAVGIDAGRGDSVFVTKTAFDDTAATAAAAELAQAGKAEQQNTLIGYAKTGALALLVLIMLIVVLVAFRRRKVETVDVLTLPEGPLDVGDITGGLKELPPVVERPAALEAKPVDPALEAAAARRTEVVELVSRQPEEVAELLRGWLADRRS